MSARIPSYVLVAAVAAGLPMAIPTPGTAQEFPSRPIEFIVPWGPGGGADQVARKLAKLMEPKLKVSLPVVNVPGATGQTGLTKMLTAPADGYSMSVFIGDTFALQAGSTPPKWKMDDVNALGVVIQQPSAFLVAEGGKFKNWADLEKAAKTQIIDVADPAEPFSAGQFAALATEAIAAARAAGQVPIVAGGTGLYLRALLHGMAPIPPRDENVRSRLYERARLETVEGLHADLQALDPESASRIGRRDLQRTVRALEVIHLTGVPLSRHLREHASMSGSLPALKVGLTMDRPLLYRRIDERVEAIFAAGIVQEVRGLLAAGVPPDCNALKALGYREVLHHLHGGIDLPSTVGLVKRNTRRYARRQLMWFRREPGVAWFDAGLQSAETIANAVAGMHAAGGA